MLFSSLTFLFIFLPIVLGLYYVTPRKLRNLVLLAASLVFYAWGEVFYVLLMLFSILFNYVCGRLIEWKRGARSLLVIGIGGNIALLSTFKYANFLTDNINTILSTVHLQGIVLAPIHLPIGISFFTFQAVSYIIDVYNQKTGVQKNVLDLGLFIALFPQLIAGPIIRYHSIHRQITSRVENVQLFGEGVQRFVIGLGKKVLIANVLAIPADKIFALGTTELTFGLAWLGIITYTLQIYFDFSGYSDMAIGLGKMFGFQFQENFNLPYISTSIREFWQRWHISLSRWFRDYLYIPLGGNRLGNRRTYFNLILVFLLVGLWHGASWNFVIWGLFHGIFITAERMGLDRLLNKTWRPFRHIYLLFVVMTAWTFFRVDTISGAVEYLSELFGMSKGSGGSHSLGQYLDNEVCLALAIGIILSTNLAQKLSEQTHQELSSTGVFKSVRAINLFATIKLTALFSIFLISVVYLAAGTYNPFIYFRF